MTRIDDVARHAGVSPATVSRVLNGAPTVDVLLAERVRAAATELGYRRNGAARSLRRQRADVVAVIISDIGNSFFTSLARGAEDRAQRQGHSVLLGNTDEDPAKEAQYLEVAAQEKVAGVILSPNHSSSDVSVLIDAGIPVCIVDRWLGAQFDTVRIDSRAAAQTATEHLFDQGWLRPACVTGPESARTAQDRLGGYLEAYRGRRLRPVKALVRHTNFQQEQARRATQSLLATARPPDSVFVANASMTLGVLAAIAEHGLEVGRDFGVITIDDPPWAQFLCPPLSVVAQPAYDIGARAVDLLLRRAEQPGRTPEEVVLPSALVARASSRRSAP